MPIRATGGEENVPSGEESVSFWALHVQLTARTGLPALPGSLPGAAVSQPAFETAPPALGRGRAVGASEEVCVPFLRVDGGSYPRANGFIFRVGPLTEPPISFPG